ncbi:MAG: flippase-like domain-containing protein [Desulfobacterales bacterium]|nr:flippase-like domain-containing protein [Desulfobacterales bacterium]
MKKNTSLSLLIGALISAVALYLAFRNVPFGDLVAYLAAIDPFWALSSVAVVMVSFTLRAYRWQVILGSSHRIGFKNAYHPLMIGFMLNCILPGRVGELARPAVLKKQEGVAYTTGLATVAVERTFDVILLLLMLVVVLATVEIDPSIDLTFGSYHLNRETLMAIGSGMTRIGIVLIAGIVLVSLEKTRQMIVTAVWFLPNLLVFAGMGAKERIHRRLCAPLVGIIDNIATGFEMVKQPGRLSLCMVLSALIWGLGAVSYYMVALAVPGLSLSFGEISTVMIIICFFIALPSVPGFWGIWEAGGVFALTLFGVSSGEAAGYALASHVIQMFPVILAGLVSALITGINLRQVAGGAPGNKNPPVDGK